MLWDDSIFPHLLYSNGGLILVYTRKIGYHGADSKHENKHGHGNLVEAQFLKILQRVQDVIFKTIKMIMGHSTHDSPNYSLHILRSPWNQCDKSYSIQCIYTVAHKDSESFFHKIHILLLIAIVPYQLGRSHYYRAGTMKWTTTVRRLLSERQSVLSLPSMYKNKPSQFSIFVSLWL